MQAAAEADCGVGRGPPNTGAAVAMSQCETLDCFGRGVKFDPAPGSTRGVRGDGASEPVSKRAPALSLDLIRDLP